MPVISVQEAERQLHGVRSVALGGMLLENRPSTLVRALIRSGAGDLFICSAPAASWDADVLIGTGQATTVRIPHISLAGLGLAPATRRAAAADTVTFQECDEALLLGGYLAASHHAAIQVLDNMGTNDLVDDNPLKHGYLTPGRAIPIRPLEAVLTEGPELHVVLLAWNFAREIQFRWRAGRAGKGDQMIHYVPWVFSHAADADLPSLE